MIYYLIEQDLQKHSHIGDYTGDLVTVLNEKELKEKVDLKEIDEDNIPRYKNSKYCRAKVRCDALSACFSLVSKDKKMERYNFGFILKPGNLIFIDANTNNKSFIKKMQKNKYHGSLKIGRFLYEFLETIIENDLRYLEEMGDRLINMESAVIKGNLNTFNNSMAVFKKEVLLLYRYYTQLVDLGEELCENENGFFTEEDISFFERFNKRAEKLREESQFLRETANQLRDVYSSQLDAKQNKIMKVLTVVTLFFMPTSTIAAWYGMNFTYMPELSSPYGYIGCFILNVIAVFLCWLYLSKKKFL